MFRKTRPSSQSYQVAAVWGAPPGSRSRRRPGSAGRGRRRPRAGRERAARPPSLLSGGRHRVGPVVDPDLAHGTQADDEQRARRRSSTAANTRVVLIPITRRDRPGQRIARRGGRPSRPSSRTRRRGRASPAGSSAAASCPRPPSRGRTRSRQPAAATVSRSVVGWNARIRFCAAVTIRSSPVVTIGRRGRHRSPASPPSSAPTPSPVTTNAHELAPSIECFATYGPSTKNGA